MNIVEKMVAIGLSTGVAGFVGLTIYFSVENWNNYTYYKAEVQKQRERKERNSGELLKKVASLATQEFALLWGFKGGLANLRESLLFLEAVLWDAEQKGVKGQDQGEAEKLWLEKLEEIAHLADIGGKGLFTKEIDEAGDIFSQVSQTHDVIRKLDKTISSLEVQLAAARASKSDNDEGSPVVTKTGSESFKERQKVFFVMGIMTAFSSRKRRDSIRETWMPGGDELKKLETEKGIIMRFVIGHSASSGGVLDRAIDAEDEKHKDFFRLNHIEGYHELSSKTQTYFTAAVSKWDADFYIKVDDDVHINLGMVGSTLARHRSKPRTYIGCMKSGPVLAHQGVKYHEPEYWKFGEEGNKYFRHATGQIYAISKDLATYISVHRHILHRYANEDVSLGSWFIGLDVQHIDERSLCCGTPPDCEWKAQAGNPCAASFDWSCSGICKSVERMEEVHQRCGEGDDAIWHTSF